MLAAIEAIIPRARGALSVSLTAPPIAVQAPQSRAARGNFSLAGNSLRGRKIAVTVFHQPVPGNDGRADGKEEYHLPKYANLADTSGDHHRNEPQGRQHQERPANAGVIKPSPAEQHRQPQPADETEYAWPIYGRKQILDVLAHL